MLPFSQDKKREGLFSIVLPLFSWWIPLIGPTITGFLIGMNLDRRKALRFSVIDSVIGSGITTAVYYLLRGFVGYPVLIVVIIFNILGSILCILVSLFISRNMTRTMITNNKLEAEFYVNNIEEIENKLRSYLDPSQCTPPKYSLSENRIEVTRKCGNMNLSYEVTEDGSNLYKVHLTISS